MSDLKVKAGDNYYYPDVVVDCGTDEYLADKPIVIIEVLSKSTAFLDKTKKLADYQQIVTLQAYVLLEQDAVRAVVYRRLDGWQGQSYQQGETVHLESIDYTFSLDDLYQSTP